MAKGLVKAKEYDWKDSNLALFGSDIEKNVNLFYFKDFLHHPRKLLFVLERFVQSTEDILSRIPYLSRSKGKLQPLN